MTPCRVVLVKHGQPVLDPNTPAREWKLSAEGEEQARRLGVELRTFIPCRLVCSPEPKALRTCEIIAGGLGIPMKTVAGLREIDRRILPIMTASEHERLHRRIFSEFDQPVLGCESALEARERFQAAVLEELREYNEGNLIVVAHGTVISLFVSDHEGVDAFALWKHLQCGSFLVVNGPRRS